MQDRFLVEHERRPVGVAIRVGGGFRLFASDPRFSGLEGRIFPRVRTLMRHVKLAARARRRPADPAGLSPQPC